MRNLWIVVFLLSLLLPAPAQAAADKYIYDPAHRGNNEALLKQVGDGVRTGDAVATVGNSGGNPDSGLYFEIRHQGKAFDPLRWVSLK